MYSDKLIAEVKRIYPDSIRIHELAEQGSPFLGRYLNDASLGSISIFTILHADSLDKLKDLARKEKEKIELYTLWANEDPRKIK